MFPHLGYLFLEDRHLSESITCFASLYINILHPRSAHKGFRALRVILVDPYLRFIIYLFVFARFAGGLAGTRIGRKIRTDVNKSTTVTKLSGVRSGSFSDHLSRVGWRAPWGNAERGLLQMGSENMQRRRAPFLIVDSQWESHRRLVPLLSISPAKSKHRQTALAARRFIGPSREPSQQRRGCLLGCRSEVAITLRCPNNWQASRRLPSCDGHQRRNL